MTATKRTQKNKAAKKVVKKKVTKKPIAKKASKKVVVKKDTKKRAPEKPKSIVITSPVDPNSRMTVSSEIADDEMIEQELMGDVLPYYVYQFCEKGCKPEVIEAGRCEHRKTTGMTVKGVNEVVRNLNKKKDSGVKIRINPVHMKIEHNVEQENEKGVQVSVYAENLIDGNSAWGIKFEPYNKPKRDGSKYKNEFAVEKALSKAERNAKRKLIPETMALKMIEKMLSNPSNVKALQAPASQSALVTPAAPKTTPTSEIEQLIRTAINTSKDVDRIIVFDKKTQNDSRLSKEFKAEVRELAAERLDKLSK